MGGIPVGSDAVTGDIFIIFKVEEYAPREEMVSGL
jgi:hypothetical protein